MEFQELHTPNTIERRICLAAFKLFVLALWVACLLARWFVHRFIRQISMQEIVLAGRQSRRFARVQHAINRARVHVHVPVPVHVPVHVCVCLGGGLVRFGRAQTGALVNPNRNCPARPCRGSSTSTSPLDFVRPQQAKTRKLRCCSPQRVSSILLLICPILRCISRAATSTVCWCR